MNDKRQHRPQVEAPSPYTSSNARNRAAIAAELPLHPQSLAGSYYCLWDGSYADADELHLIVVDLRDGWLLVSDLDEEGAPAAQQHLVHRDDLKDAGFYDTYDQLIRSSFPQEMK